VASAAHIGVAAAAMDIPCRIILNRVATLSCALSVNKLYTRLSSVNIRRIPRDSFHLNSRVFIVAAIVAIVWMHLLRAFFSYFNNFYAPWEPFLGTANLKVEGRFNFMHSLTTSVYCRWKI